MGHWPAVISSLVMRPRWCMVSVLPFCRVEQEEPVMPRIAAVLLAFAVIACSIGFNVARYSRVWEMVGASPDLPQSGESSQSATAMEPAADRQSPASAESSAPWQPIPVEPAVDDPAGCDVQPAAEVTSSGRCTSDATCVELTSGKRLVPVIRYQTPRPSAGERPELGNRLRRLPPVDRATSFGADRFAVPPVGSPIPFYPSTK